MVKQTRPQIPRCSTSVIQFLPLILIWTKEANSLLGSGIHFKFLPLFFAIKFLYIFLSRPVRTRPSTHVVQIHLIALMLWINKLPIIKSLLHNVPLNPFTSYLHSKYILHCQLIKLSPLIVVVFIFLSAYSSKLNNFFS